jgi:general stress protein 26
MDQPCKDFVLRVLDSAHDLTLATVRDDGYPQATIVSFAHDDLALYVGIGRHCQKAANISHNNKVSLAVSLPYREWNEIRGLSMSGQAEILQSEPDIDKAKQCLMQRFPQVQSWAGPDMSKEIAFLRIKPEVISVLDYTKGFGHTELVTV